MKLWADCRIRPQGPGFGAFQNDQGQAEGSGVSTIPFTQAKKRFSTESDSAWTLCQKSPLALCLCLLGKHMVQLLHLPQRVPQGTETLGNKLQAYRSTPPQ